MNWTYKTRKQIGQGLFLAAGALILSLCFYDPQWWKVTVFALTGVLVFCLFRLGRCRNCARQIHFPPGEEQENCPHCGTKINS